MKPVVRSVTVVAFLVLSPLTLKGQRTEDPGLTSFFQTLTSEFSAQDVFAIDPRSFSELLRDSLDWEVTPHEVEDFLGGEFRYGRLDRFLACEAPGGCFMAERGAHVSLGGVSAIGGADRISLLLDLTGTTDDPALIRRVEFLTLQRSDAGWRVQTLRVIGRGRGPTDEGTAR